MADETGNVGAPAGGSENTENQTLNDASIEKPDSGTEHDGEQKEQQEHVHYEEKMEKEEGRYDENGYNGQPGDNDNDEEENNGENEKKEFNFEEFAEEVKEETSMDYNGYDLSEFAEELDFEDSATIEKIEALSAEAKEMGFTQEQAAWMLKRDIEANAREAEAEATPEQIKEYLNKNLNRAEKKDYAVVGTFLKEKLAGTGSEARLNEAMSNPAVYKLVRDLYNSVNKTQEPIKEQKKVISKGIKTEKAMDNYVSRLRNGEERTAIINDIISNAEDKDAVKKIFVDYM